MLHKLGKSFHKYSVDLISHERYRQMGTAEVLLEFKEILRLYYCIYLEH